ncbi:glycosyltransferase [Novosphingobium sp. Rr 2-17]|uniref:glycosyltransferase family 4 protein n=1 Tax=Novosphingobium sp. Rr 2-17 TaxID=555793 RepID=UPI0002697AE9|nr:glycosyltransferase family 4 protein [Novosphingobium sp. Rr 2-17]EIZ81185.1 glycosyltransferase [Novosphingobium sp. Rr 2-17]
MTRALFVSHTAEKGGAELFLMDVVRGGTEDWQACFLSDGPAAAELAAAGKAALVLSAGKAMLAIRRGSGPGAMLRGAAAVVAVARELSLHARRYDIVCANSQKSLFVCAGAALLAKRPLVWILHDIITDPAFSAANRKAAVTIANTFASAVVVNSEETRDAFIQAGGKASLTHLVYNGFEVAAWPRASIAEGQRLRSAFGLDARPVVSIFGRLTQWKGQHVLLEALARVPGTQGLIVGGGLFGQDAWEQHLHNQAKALGISDRVQFAGFRDDVARLMAGSDVIVHASTAPEPFGRVVVEGMLTGRPVIATQGGAIDSIIEDGRTGLVVPPSDPDALAAAIQRLIAAPEQASAMGAAGRIDVAARFDLAQTRAALAAVFAPIVSAKGAG